MTSLRSRWMLDYIKLITSTKTLFFNKVTFRSTISIFWGRGRNSTHDRALCFNSEILSDYFILITLLILITFIKISWYISQSLKKIMPHPHYKA